MIGLTIVQCQNNGLKKIQDTSYRLKRLARNCNLIDPENVKAYIATAQTESTTAQGITTIQKIYLFNSSTANSTHPDVPLRRRLRIVTQSRDQETTITACLLGLALQFVCRRLFRKSYTLINSAMTWRKGLSKRTIHGTALTLLLAVTLGSALNILPVIAAGTIYIRADGSIDPPTANIATADGITYTFTNNMSDSIVVERNNIVVDGAGYTLQGTGWEGCGINLTGRTNVTIRNTNIKDFDEGIWLWHSSNNSISGNNITNCGGGITMEYYSEYNSISGNNIANNLVNGISARYSCEYNSISGNKIADNIHGITLAYSSNSNNITDNNITANSYVGIELIQSFSNTVSGNSITASAHYGIRLCSSSSNIISGNSIRENNDAGVLLQESVENRFYHNDFVNNNHPQVIWDEGDPTICPNVWDDGYPSGGNFWTDYWGVDADPDGIGDTPHVIDAFNQDNYPLKSPYAYWCNPIPGDVNKDAKVDMRDIGALCRRFGTTPSSPNWNPNCDINGDGKVDMRDIVIAVQHFGEYYIP